MSVAGRPGYQETAIGWIPADWSVTSLGAVGRCIRGVSYKPEHLHAEPSDRTVTLLRSNNIRDGRVNFNEIQLVSNENVSSDQSIRLSDIAICMSNGSKSLVGKSGVVKIEHLAIQPKLTVGAFCSIYRSKYPYAAHVFQSSYYQSSIDIQLSGSAINNLKGSDIEGIQFPWPSLPEQQKIASILTAVDDKLDVIARQIANAKILKRGLMQTLFSRGVGTLDTDGRWVPHTEFKDSELGEIPVVWDVRSLESIADVERGKFSARPRNDPKYFDGGDIPFIQTGDIAAANRFVRTGSQFLNKEGLAVSRMFPAGTIFITIAANIGDVAISQIPLSCPDSVVGINATSEICDGIWLYYLLSNNKDYFDSRATQNAQKNINLQVLRPFLVAMPPLSEQRVISEILTVVDDKLDTLQVKQDHYKTLKRGLMQKLLTGEWRVKLDGEAAHGD